MASFGATTENLRFCKVWTNDGYEFTRNATEKDSDDETLTCWDRFRVTEIFGQVPDNFRWKIRL